MKVNMKEEEKNGTWRGQQQMNGVEGEKGVGSCAMPAGWSRLLRRNKKHW